MSLEQKIPIPHATRGVNNKPWEVTIAYVRALLQRGEDFLLLDCRSVEEWETASIEGAMNLPLQQFSTRGQELDAYRDRPIVIYCRTGRRSAIVAKYLQMSGFSHVRSMAGGIEAWTEYTKSSSSG